MRCVQGDCLLNDSNILASTSAVDLLAADGCVLYQSVRVATALNWQMFCGCIAPSDIMPGSFDPINYNSSFAKKFEEVKQFALPFVTDFKVSTRCHSLR